MVDTTRPRCRDVFGVSVGIPAQPRHSQPVSRKSPKSRRLVARTKKSERKSERRKKKGSRRMTRGWWRVDAVARLREGAVRQCLRYKLQGIGRGGRARRSLCPSPAVCSSGGLPLGASGSAPIRSPLEKRLSVSSSSIPFSLIIKILVHPCSPLRGGRRRGRESSRRRIFARPAASASPPSNRFPPPR